MRKSDKFYSIIIMDGFGIAPPSAGNAILNAGTPYVDYLRATYPNTKLGASGLSVGLPDGQMGNSEVGHLNMGAGRIIYQDLTRITKSIEDGDFFTNEALVGAMKYALEKGKRLHLYGLLSDGGVHSHNTHLYALLRMAKQFGLKDVFVHCFMDGRDVSPTSGLGFIKDLEREIEAIGVGKIATVCGRFYAMDRDFAWDRNEKAYNMLTKGEGLRFRSAEEAMQDSYDRGVTDEFVLPSVVVDAEGQPVGSIQKEDAIIFFNFRPDRARQITRAFIFPVFDSFPRDEYLNPYYVCFKQYDEKFTGVDIAFKPQEYVNTFGEYVSKMGYTQLRIAETQKYAHVTFFFNGGVEAPNPNEDRVLIPSPDVATFDMKPEMSAYEVAAKACELIKGGKYDLMVLNFANCDMVGHTGIIPAAEKAVKAVDECVKQVVETVLSIGGTVLLTADHGNAEKMIADDGTPHTAHTTNLVPLILIDDAYKNVTLHEGILADIVPTLFEVMHLEQPKEMTGKSLINH
ncbi:MAG: 2,3-bisphosphoglycerate-independent phosphoglycerate mutase [Clostridia bacterium]|nr:2,3-bisphosphoglycerate-independent phosphoglycerate mutase [Clostridia bacterium]